MLGNAAVDDSGGWNDDTVQRDINGGVDESVCVDVSNGDFVRLENLILRSERYVQRDSNLLLHGSIQKRGQVERGLGVGTRGNDDGSTLNG